MSQTERPIHTATFRETFRLDRLELAFTLLFVATACLSWVGVTLAAFGAFNGWTLLAGTLTLSIIGWVWVWRSLGPHLADTAVGRGTWAFLVVLLAASALIIGRPAEAVISADDGSVYPNIGHIIERAGSASMDEPLVGLIDPADLPALFPPEREPPPLLNRFPGGIQIENGRTIGSFFPLFPVWIASFNIALGPFAGFYISPLCGVLSVLALFLLTRRISSPFGGAVAAALLTLVVGQIWFARLPYAEMLGQFLGISGIFFTVLTLAGGPPVVAVCGAAAFGLASFTRLEFLLFVAPLILIWAFSVLRMQPRRGVWIWFVGVFTLLLVQAWLHALSVAQAYTIRILHGLFYPLVAGNWRRALALAIAATPWVLWVLWRSNRLGPLAKRIILLVLVPAAGALIWTVGPGLFTGVLGLLLTPLGVVLAFGGLALMIVRERDHRAALIALLFILPTVLFIQARIVNPTIPIGFRRFMPLGLPLAMMYVGFLTARLKTSGAFLARLALVLPLLLGGWLLYNSLPILRTPSMQGVYRQVESLAHQIPHDALVLADRSIPSHLAMSLTFTFDRESVLVPRSAKASAAARRLVNRVLDLGRPVYLVTTGRSAAGGDSIRLTDLDGFIVSPVAERAWEYSQMRSTRTSISRTLHRVRDSVELYELRRAGEHASAIPLPLRLDIGLLDFGYIRRGFYARERAGLTRTRWIDEDAELAIPPLRGTANHAGTLSIRASAYRPAGVPRGRMSLELDGREIAVIQRMSREFRVYRFPLDPGLVQGLQRGGRLRLRSTSFIPAESGAGKDARRLAAKLDWVTIEGAEPP